MLNEAYEKDYVNFRPANIRYNVSNLLTRAICMNSEMLWLLVCYSVLYQNRIRKVDNIFYICGIFATAFRAFPSS